jgi:hypothetical protein
VASARTFFKLLPRAWREDEFPGNFKFLNLIGFWAVNKILLFGTSRLHRPFAKRLKGQLIANTQEGMEIVFPKMGYFHSAAEILQAIRFLKNPKTVPLHLRPYIFRVEPRGTTPLNEFDVDLENAIKNEEIYATNLPFSEVRNLVIEVSSLSVNKHIPSGCVLHTNPNFLRNVAYKDIYPEGYYSKFESDMPVEKSETGVEDLAKQLSEIRHEFPHANVIVMGHLRSESYPHAMRDKIHQNLSAVARRAGCIYFDTAPFLDKFGFDNTDGVRDIHHISHDGEFALGSEIFNLVRSLN